MKSDDRFNFAKLTQPVILMAFFWVIAVVLWQIKDNIFLLFNFLYLGTAIGVGVGLYMALPRRKKHWGRRVSQVLMGGYLLLFLGVMKQENMQLEGFFYYLMAGFFSGSLIQFLKLYRYCEIVEGHLCNVAYVRLRLMPQTWYHIRDSRRYSMTFRLIALFRSWPLEISRLQRRKGRENLNFRRRFDGAGRNL